MTEDERAAFDLAACTQAVLAQFPGARAVLDRDPPAAKEPAPEPAPNRVTSSGVAYVVVEEREPWEEDRSVIVAVYLNKAEAERFVAAENLRNSTLREARKAYEAKTRDLRGSLLRVGSVEVILKKRPSFVQEMLEQEFGPAPTGEPGTRLEMVEAPMASDRTEP